MKYIFTAFILLTIAIRSLSQAGTLTQSFGDTGKVLTQYKNTSLQCFASAIQSDNKIVVVGSTDSIGVNGLFLVLRYLSNGSLDNSFGINGKATIDFGYDDHTAYAVAIQADGGIVITGYGVTGFFDPVYDILTARLKSNGTLDSSFGNNGKVITDLDKKEIAYSLCIQPDGKIIVSGNYDNINLLLIRFKTNGTLDSTFGTNGKVINTQISNMAFPRSVVVQPDGKIVTGGDMSGTTPVCLITRYKTNGTLDSTFGTGGIVINKFTNYGDQILKLLIQQDGKIIGVGRTGLYSASNANKSVIAIRYKTNGSLDSSYGTSGISTIHFAHTYSEGTSGALQTDGKLLISGYTAGDYVLLRLKTNGSLDTSFGTGGSTITDFNGLADQPYGIVIQSGDSSIVLAGSSMSDRSTDTLAVSLAAYDKYGTRQKIVLKIRRWLQHHNGITWDNINGACNYAVQRSGDGIKWATIYRSPLTDSSQGSVNYFQDPSPLNGTNYYRVQATGVNGAVNYSNVIAITNNEHAITISPNPAKNSLHIDGLSSGKTNLTVADFAGNIKLQAVANNSSYNLNIASLKQGNYILKIEMNGEVVTKKFVKE